MNSATQGLTLRLPREARRPFLDWFDCLCALLLVVSFLIVSRLPAPSKFGDVYFHEEAKSLSLAIRGVASWREVAFARAPGPALYYSVPYLLVSADAPNESYWRAAVAWNGFWILVAILLIRRTADMLWREPAGKAAAILALLLPFPVYYSFGVAAESPAYVATAILLYGWALWRSNEGARLFSKAGFVSLAGLLALFLCRPNALVVLGITAVCGVILFLRRPSSAADRRFAVLCVLTGIVTVLVVSLGLKHLPGNRGLGSQASNFDEAMFLSSFQFRTESWDWRFWGKGTRQGSADYQNYAAEQKMIERESATTNVPVGKLQLHWALRDLAEHPLTHFKMFAVRLLALNVWIINSTRPAAFRLGPLRGTAVYVAFHIFLNIIALAPLFASFWFLVRERGLFASYWPLWGPWLALLLFHSLTYAEPRYMLPAQPGLAVMAACVLAQRKARRPEAMPLSAHGSELLCQ